MNIKNNNNFISVEAYPNLKLIEVWNLAKTAHGTDRDERRNRALSHIQQTTRIEHCFLIDKGHKDGKEIHCVTNDGIIFILNQHKYESNVPSLITYFLARPNQVKRLYDELGYPMSKRMWDACQSYIRNGENR